MTHSRPTFFKQSGAALPVALVMLLISTVIGLSSMRSATQQEKISSNLYDRSLAYQAAEAALREAEKTIMSTSNSQSAFIPCTEVVSKEDACLSIPPFTFTEAGKEVEEDKNWIPINVDPDNTESTSEDDVSSAGTPQYYIQNLGSTGGIAELGSERSANDDAYESMGKAASGATLYRITARSSNPEDSKNRALVVLQATIKKNT